MNSSGYLKLIVVLGMGTSLMFGFNNCSKVAFQEMKDGSMTKISSNDIVDTNVIDGNEINDSNMQDYIEVVNDLAVEQEGSDDTSSSDMDENEESNSEEQIGANEQQEQQIGEQSSSEGEQEVSQEQEPSQEELMSDDNSEEETVVSEEKKNENREESKKKEAVVDYETFKCPRIDGEHKDRDKFAVICHFPPGNPNNPQTLCISIHAVDKHMRQHKNHKQEGVQDISGPCESLALE